MVFLIYCLGRDGMGTESLFPTLRETESKNLRLRGTGRKRNRCPDDGTETESGLASVSPSSVNRILQQSAQQTFPSAMWMK